MNLSFKRPYNDTCRICDELRMKLENKNLDEEDRKKHELEKQDHLAKVDKVYTTKQMIKCEQNQLLAKLYSKHLICRKC